MCNSVERHAPVQRQKVKRCVLLFEDFLYAANDVDGVAGALVFPETVLCLSQVCVEHCGKPGLYDAGINFVDGRQQGDWTVVAWQAGVPLFVNTCN